MQQNIRSMWRNLGNMRFKKVPEILKMITGTGTKAITYVMSNKLTHKNLIVNIL